jgi:DNA-binding beta-propeller fold protein YncE
MLRRIAVVTAVFTFGLSGVALLYAGSPQRSSERQAGPRRQYLNPMGVALSADGRRAYVALSRANVVATVDLETGKVMDRRETGPQPVEVRRDGGTLYVSDAKPEYLVIDLSTGRARREGSSRLPDGRSRPRAEVEVPFVKGEGSFGLHLDIEPDWALNDPGRGVTNNVFSNSVTTTVPYDSSRPVASGPRPLGVLGVSGSSNQMTGRMDNDRIGGADPADAARSAATKTLFVAASGSNTILAYSTKSFEGQVKTLSPPGMQFQGALGFAGGNGWGGGPPPTPLTLPRAVALRTQSNPRRIAISEGGRTVVVSNTLSDSLTVIAADGLGSRVVKHIPLGGPPPDAVRRGEVLFHSAQLTFNQRFSCASCHPGGGSDGRVWNTPAEDPGARRTKSLLGVAETAPYGWRGDSATLADRVRKTLGKLHKASPSPAQVNDLVAYLESLPPPKPKEVLADDRDRYNRGRALFEGEAGCARCHAGPTFQDGDVHDVGYEGAFRTPSLRGVSDRKPLLHDGRAFSIEDIFKHHNQKKRHGIAHTLSEDELADLIEYVKTL